MHQPKLSTPPTAARLAHAELLDAVTSNVTSALFMTDERGFVTYMNPAAVAATGFVLDELREKTLHDALHHSRPDGSVYHAEDCPLHAVFTLHRPVRGEEVFLRKDGSFFPVSFSISPLLREGRFLGAVVEFQDISATKRNEAELRESLRHRDEFLSIASHELRSPLTALRLKLQILERQTKRDAGRAFHADDLLHQLSFTLKHVDSLSRMVDKLLDLSRIRAGLLELERTSIDLRELVAEVVSRFRPQAEQRGASLHLGESAPLPLYVDPIRLDQVFTNLITNALKYGEGKPVAVSFSRTNDEARVTVRDQGPGIAPEDQERIFGAFERATEASRKDSLGLGLFITHQLVKAHGGRIEVESRPGEGAKFTVCLPLAERG